MGIRYIHPSKQRFVSSCAGRSLAIMAPSPRLHRFDLFIKLRNNYMWLASITFERLSTRRLPGPSIPEVAARRLEAKLSALQSVPPLLVGVELPIALTGRTSSK